MRQATWIAPYVGTEQEREMERRYQHKMWTALPNPHSRRSGYLSMDTLRERARRRSYHQFLSSWGRSWESRPSRN